jgi:8-oxo-dGTP pyrophosphatase MutT (NUDIX family)
MKTNWLTQSSGYISLQQRFSQYLEEHISCLIDSPREEAIEKLKELKHIEVVKQNYELAAHIRQIEKDLIFNRAAMALILDPTPRQLILEGKVLAVSRKNDFTRMGLPGGKVEYHETFEEAVVRETLEETGLDVEIVAHIFDRYDDNFIGKTYLCKMKDPDAKIFTNEPVRVDWVEWQELFDGPFGEYNKNLYDHISRVQ